MKLENKSLKKESRLERTEMGIYYKVDEESARIYLGGNPQNLGDFLGRLDARDRGLQQDEETLKTLSDKWKRFLEDWLKLKTYSEKVNLSQLNFGSQRVFICDPKTLRMLEKLGLQKSIQEGGVKEADLPKIVFQYLYNGTATPEHFKEIKDTLDGILAKMKES